MNIRDIQRKVGLEFVFEQLEVKSPFGRELIKDAGFYQSSYELSAEFERISLLRANKDLDAISHELDRHLGHLKDVRASMERIRRSVRLTIDELYEIKFFLIEIIHIAEIYNKDVSLPGIPLQDMTPALDILDPRKERKYSFSIWDNASEKLAQIRSRKREIEARLFGAENNAGIRLKWDEICAAEDAEEKAVCEMLSKKLSPYGEQMIKNAENAGRIDLLIRKAKMQGTVVPVIRDGDMIFVEMINPEISARLNAGGEKFIPVSIEAGSGATVITGANMGGKSVALKTIALNVALCMCGFPVFAKRALLGMISDICLIYENYENSAQGLSSFGGEMVRISEAIEGLNRESLLLLDEPARGTNPDEGAAIVKGLVEYLNSLESISLVATHFDGVASLGGRHYRIDDFHLKECALNEPIPRKALETCRLLGMNEKILIKIEKHLDDRK
ncbi:MAG: MutS-related protein [Lachnospiraceae bacterium]